MMDSIPLPWYEESDSDCWNDTEPQQMGTQSYFDCLLSEDEIFDSDLSEDEDEEEMYLSCFMVNKPVCANNVDSGMTNKVNSDDELLRQEVVEGVVVVQPVVVAGTPEFKDRWYITC